MRQPRKTWVLLIAVVLALVVAAGGVVAYRSRSVSHPEPTRIGTLTIYSSFALTGPAHASSMSIVNAITLALEESGGKAGAFGIDHRSLDDSDPATQSWDAALEAANAKRAAADAAAVAYIGTSSSAATRVALPILSQAKLPMLSPTNRAGDLTKDPAAAKYYPTGTRTFFRVVPSELAQGTAAARWLRDLGRTRVFVIDDGTPYGTGTAGAFVSAAPRAGLEIVARETAGRTAEFAALAQKVAASRSTAVLYAGLVDSRAADLVRQLRSFDARIAIVGLDGIACEEFLKQTGPAAEGTFAMFAGVPIDQYAGAQRAWLDRYRARFGSDPDLFAAYGYEAARVLLAAIALAGERAVDRGAVTEALRKVGQEYDGLFGKWSFDAEGDTTAVTHTGIVARGGRWAFAKILN